MIKRSRKCFKIIASCSNQDVKQKRRMTKISSPYFAKRNIFVELNRIIHREYKCVEKLKTKRLRRRSIFINNLVNISGELSIHSFFFKRTFLHRFKKIFKHELCNDLLSKKKKPLQRSFLGIFKDLRSIS